MVITANLLVDQHSSSLSTVARPKTLKGSSNKVSPSELITSLFY